MNRRSVLPLACGLALAGFPASATAQLTVTDLGKSYEPDPRRVAIRQTEANTGGSTSVRNTDRDNLEWKENGYYQRNRDLGQVFTPEKDFVLEAIVLRTGPTDNAVLAGTPGAGVFVQFFEVTGEPKIDDNGTPPGTDAKHGFTKNHRADDFIVGVEYEPIRVVEGGKFPDMPPTKDAQGNPVADQSGRFRYMRWAFEGDGRLTFRAGKRYAFMVGFTEPGNNRGFTLANANQAGNPAPPALDDRLNTYAGGWGLRREGNGKVPPTMIPGEGAPTDADTNEKLIDESLFATGPGRYDLSPTTDGYPDVDTYRDLEFYMEVSPAADGEGR